MDKKIALNIPGKISNTNLLYKFIWPIKKEFIDKYAVSGNFLVQGKNYFYIFNGKPSVEDLKSLKPLNPGLFLVWDLSENKEFLNDPDDTEKIYSKATRLYVNRKLNRVEDNEFTIDILNKNLPLIQSEWEKVLIPMIRDKKRISRWLEAMDNLKIVYEVMGEFVSEDAIENIIDIIEDKFQEWFKSFCVKNELDYNYFG